MKKLGTRLAVFKGKARQTTGGLTRSMLSKSKFGKIVSKKKQLQAKQKSNLKGFLQGRGGAKKAPKLHRRESKVSVPVPKAKQRQAPKLFRKQSKVSVPIPKAKPRQAPKLFRKQSRISVPVRKQVVRKPTVRKPPNRMMVEKRRVQQLTVAEKKKNLRKLRAKQKKRGDLRPNQPRKRVKQLKRFKASDLPIRRTRTR